MTDPLYNITDLYHAYGDKPALEVPSLAIPRAAIVGLLGPNGSGKSTLLKLLGFVIRPTRGTILFKGRPAAPFSDAVRFRVTLLPQDPYLMKRTVFQNIDYGLRLRGNSGDHKIRIKDALEKVGLNYRDFAHRSWHALSGGEAQRVAMAARLALEPEVLLLDEPIASVDAASIQRIKEAALSAREQWGTTLMIASHDREWLEDICDSILFLFNGRIMGSEMGNIIFGPWQRDSESRYEKRLRDGQRLRVPAPPDAAAVALIAPGDIDLCTGGGNAVNEGDACTLRGVVTRISLEGETRRIRITVSVGNLLLMVSLSGESLQKQPLVPGQEIRVCYRPGDVRWIGGRE